MAKPVGTPIGPTAAFPTPPPTWRLFRRDSEVAVVPPRPPTGQIFAFGEPLRLEAPTPPIDADEWLCDPEAEDLGKELLKLQRSLESTSLELLEGLLQNPSEHPSHLREFGSIVKNIRGLLHILREREARALLLQQFREQVDRKRRYINDVSIALPGLEARFESLSEELASEEQPPRKKRATA
eukprot:TRINITY_DN19631_c0_g1_i1.p1 TRINITY_DN19631_c0_g1~~TRINITY_DN19631_c0_g1_i1.p1  ORF type:complete len:207 (-),score=29.71 TRINITY_DN19631_c0_g1_i1:297-845(-)